MFDLVFMELSGGEPAAAQAVAVANPGTGRPGPLSLRIQVRERVPEAGSPDVAAERRDRAEISESARDASRAEADAESPEAGVPVGRDGEPLSDAEQDQVEELEARDREVRTHEQAHKAAAGPYATSGPTYSYQTGPDGKRYAVGGSVGIDLSPEDSPEATIQKMAVVRRAALAPAEPSSQDRRVAAQASRIAQEARQELQAQRQAEAVDDEDTDAANNTAEVSDSFETTNASRSSADGAPASLGESGALIDQVA